jgi:hypothetical protein
MDVKELKGLIDLIGANTLQALLSSGDDEEHPLLGKKVFIRTVTFYYVGRLVGVSAGLLELEQATWVADTGLFGEALKSGKFKEFEDYPDSVYVNADAIVDMSEWDHPLPRD